MHPNEYLIKLANTCDSLGFTPIADNIDNLIKDKSFIKVAQYVGVSGYMQKLTRSIQNCQRIKGSESNRPRQEIVMECLSEFQDGQNYNDEKWIGKYASQNEKQYIDNLFKEGVKQGLSIESISKYFIQKIAQENNIDEEIEKINKLWESIEKSSLDKNAEFEGMGYLLKKVAQLGLWQGTKNLWRKMRGGEEQQISGNLAEIQKNLQLITQKVSTLLPIAQQVGKILKINPITQYDKFYYALQQYVSTGQTVASTSWSKNWEKMSQYNPVLPQTQPQPQSQPQTQPQVQQQPQVDQNAVWLFNQLDSVQKYFGNINNLIAKLRTFPNITSNPDVRQEAETAFTTFNQMYSGKISPFNYKTLNSLSSSIGDLQQKMQQGGQTTSEEKVPVDTDGDGVVDAEKPKTEWEETVKNLQEQALGFMKKLTPEQRFEVIQMLKESSEPVPLA